jgi:hypothetical protein
MVNKMDCKPIFVQLRKGRREEEIALAMIMTSTLHEKKEGQV